MTSDFSKLSSPFFIIKTLQREKLRHFGPRISGKVLDIGCGKQPFKKLISYTTYTGMDLDPEVSPDIVGSIDSIPFSDQYFNSVLCNEVLEHVPDPLLALKEVSRALVSGGILYITTPMTWYLHYEPHDFWRYTKYGLTYLLEKSGFKVLQINRYGGLFSIIFQFSIDFWYFKFLSLIRFLPKVVRESLTTVIFAPLSLIALYLSKVLDKLDQKHALGWVVLAQKI